MSALGLQLESKFSPAEKPQARYRDKGVTHFWYWRFDKMKKVSKGFFEIESLYFGNERAADKSQYLTKKTKVTIMDGGEEWEAVINVIYFRIDLKRARPENRSVYLDISWVGGKGTIEEPTLIPIGSLQTFENQKG